MSFQGIPYTEMPEESRKSKECVVCKTEFIPRSGVHKFCSDSCKGKWKYISGQFSTENQYKNISGDWQRYFNRLVRRSEKRTTLSVKDLEDKLVEQGGKCALSGVKLTCLLEVGKKNKTNASLDRLVPGGEYTKDNVQLVCSALNSWRGDTELQEFIWFCKQVTEYQESKE